MHRLHVIGRRAFLQAVPWGALAAVGTDVQRPGRCSAASPRLFFTTQGRTALIHADGSGLRYFDFKVPGQATWQPGPFLADGKRVIFLSMEARRDGAGRPFAEYYHRTPTHLWIYDLEHDRLTEIATRDRLAVFYTPALVVADDRLLIQVVRDQGGQIYSMNLDGSDPREFTRAGEGLPYGLSLSPDGQRVAYHLASPDGYQVWTSDTRGGNRVVVAAHRDHLYFGPNWSADGQWLTYQDCHFETDPGHDWSDICIGRPDGSEHRVLTEGQAAWFAASYGRPGNRGSGSNVPAWTSDQQILFPRRWPGSKVAWEFQAQRPDTDHFNREFKPELASGGTEICKISPATGAVTRLTQGNPPNWDFRACESPTGDQVAFCRCATGESPALWVMHSDGSEPQLLTRGLGDQGVDHPRWLPAPD